ncbi:hypothetical protein SASPL_108264 [Salvia splendens]|uniref:Uncharacterized protein n=1 Tax=Salvia splendens TaxID=180675 RepID=A0A8X9A577_SALSN|nr:hypothetical protein SASPL_108264 [Salvia splendens]
MPATAGRVRMPANNRVHSSAALQTHGIWQSAIGYDPYAPNKEEKSNASAQNSVAASEGEQEKRLCYAKSDDDKAIKDNDAIQAAVLSGLEKLKGKKLRSEDSSEDEESESSDTDYDSGEKLVAVSDVRERKKKEKGERGRSKNRKSAKRRCSSDSDDEDSSRKKRRKEKRRKRDDDSSEEEEEKEEEGEEKEENDYSSDNSVKQRHKCRSRRADSASGFGDSESDDGRVGRDKKRSDKKSRDHRRRED